MLLIAIISNSNPYLMAHELSRLAFSAKHSNALGKVNQALTCALINPKYLTYLTSRLMIGRDSFYRFYQQRLNINNKTKPIIR